MAYGAAHDVDANILVVDASVPFGPGDEYILSHLDINNAPLIIVFNKIDEARLDKVENLKKIYAEKVPGATFIDTVATEKFNIDTLLNKIIELNEYQYIEKEVKEIKPDKKWRYNKGIHTINSDGGITVFDAKKFTFTWQGFVQQIKQKLC